MGNGMILLLGVILILLALAVLLLGIRRRRPAGIVLSIIGAGMVLFGIYLYSAVMWRAVAIGHLAAGFSVIAGSVIGLRGNRAIRKK